MQTRFFARKMKFDRSCRERAGTNGARRIFWVALLGLCLWPQSAFAQCSSTWSGGSSGSWNTAGNWTPSGVPTGSSNTCISTASSAVTVSDGSTANLTLGLSSDSLAISDGTILTVSGSTISNTGTITLNASTGNFTALEIASPAVTLTGGGNLTLSDSFYNDIQASSSGSSLTNVNNTISGAGNIGNNSGMSFINDAGGIVNATSPSGTSLIIQPGTGAGVGTTNLGLMEASSGGSLALEDRVTNTGGTIEALAGGAVNLNGTDLIGGTLTSVGTGVILGFNSAVLDGTSGHSVTITAGSNLQTPDGNTISMQGAIINNGTISVNSMTQNTVLNILGATTLSGSGTVIMSNFSVIQGGGTLTNKQTIQGGGTIGNNNLTLVNSGIIDADNSNLILVNPSGGTTNTGTMEATSSGLLELQGSVTNTGGTLLATGSSSSGASEVFLDGASVTGGTLTSTAGGVIEEQNGGTLTSVTLSTGTTLNVDDKNILNLGTGTITNKGTININSTGDETFLNIQGSVTLTGPGKVVLSNNAQNLIGGTGTLTNQGTIEGEGNIGDAQIGLINTGSILANEKTASTLFIDTSGSGFSNSSGTKNGILNVSVNNTLIIEGGPFTNFSSGTLTGGSYIVAGKLEFAAGTKGIATNDAGITLTGATAEILNTTNGKNALTGLTTNGTKGSLTLASNQDFTTSGSLTNSGTIDIQKSTGKGTTALIIGGTGNFAQTGGTTTVDGKLTTSGALNISGGFVYGNGGTLTGKFTLAGGTINPGDGLKKVGVLNVSGSYTQGASGILNIDLDGTTPDTKYDVLNISGAAALGGTLNVDALTGFTPTVGEQFDILNYGSETGKFSVVDCNFSNGDTCSIAYNSAGAVLTIDAPAVASSTTRRNVTGSPAKRVSRGLMTGGAADGGREPVAILARAVCFGARMLMAPACGMESIATAASGSELHATSVGAGGETVHNNVMGAMRPMSGTRGDAGRESSAWATAMARLYVCAYFPSSVTRTMGCN
jgi:hypothetical protein